MDKCPHCGCGTYFREITFSGQGIEYFEFDGSPANNETIHDSLVLVRGEAMHCADCKAVVEVTQG